MLPTEEVHWTGHDDDNSMSEEDQDELEEVRALVPMTFTQTGKITCILYLGQLWANNSKHQETNRNLDSENEG